MLLSAIIGCGRSGESHARAFQNCPDIQLVACIDQNPEKAKAFANDWSCSGYSLAEMNEVFSKGDIQIVSVCTWLKSHATLTAEVARYRGVRGIICEKPIARNLSEADFMIRACGEAKIRLAIGHQRRFAKQHRKVRELIQGRTLGDIRWIIIHCSHPLMLMQTHTIDLARFYLDTDVLSVYGCVGEIDRELSQLHGVPIERQALATLTCANGSRVLLCTNGNGTPDLIWIIGSAGSIKVELDGKLELIGGSSGASLTEARFEKQQAFDEEVNAMAAWIVRDEPNLLATGKDGRAALEVIQAIFESARRNDTVRLPMGSPPSNQRIGM